MTLGAVIVASLVLALVLDWALARATRWLRIRTQVLRIEIEALDAALVERIRERRD